MMAEPPLGRLLPAVLHQAIDDVLPDRLEYYEEWLSPDGLRDGDIGLAPVSAVIGFLRTEGGAYDRVVDRAGTLAATWSIAALPPLQRRFALSLPQALRCRFALRVARRVSRDVFAASAASTKMRRGRAELRLQSSVFCGVRERQSQPLCGFYAALARETLRAFQIPAATTIESCRAMAGPECVIAIQIGAAGVMQPAIAA